MAAIKPTPSQQELISESNEGIYLVDAGPGTGKTYTITQRYVSFLESKIATPEDILMITFTENAANQMKNKVIQATDYDPAELFHAPISTFHAHCKKILEVHGFNAPKYLDIDDTLPPTIQIIESEVMELPYFRIFVHKFIDDFPQYNKIHQILAAKYRDLLHLLKLLTAKGIIPLKNGWFQDGEKYLNGDIAQFEQIFNQQNIELSGRQSRLRSRFRGFKYNEFKFYLPEDPAPCEVALRGVNDRRFGGKTLNSTFVKTAFNEDRELLLQFIHDLYYEYIKFALQSNYLNFGFLILFAYLLLCNDHKLQEALKFDYIMVDEFQDTNEIQFKLVLLLSKSGNIFVVGDWKQSIYGFQFASVENIIEFKKRIKTYQKELNKDYKRIPYSCDSIHYKELKENHRSSQKLIDFSEKSLLVRANTNESLDKNDIKSKIVKLAAQRKDIKPKIELICATTDDEEKKKDNEKLVILNKIQEIVGNPNYEIEDKNGTKIPPNYGDIAILARNRKFGLKLQKLASKHGIPVSFEAGIEVFKEDCAILLLAWLRIYNNNLSQKGWVVILEEAGYLMDEMRIILKSAEKSKDIKDYPKEMVDFLKELKQYKDIGIIARKVFEKYGINNTYADKIIEILQNTYENTLMNMGQLIEFIENSIRGTSTYVTDSRSKEDVVKIQTIHAAKGLEYPIVFVSDINKSRFPSTIHTKGIIFYEDSVGIRQRKLYKEGKNSFVYDNWKAEFVIRCLTKDYDEERRLFYVAMTRARDHLILTSDCNWKSMFFDDLMGDRSKLEGKNPKEVDGGASTTPNILKIELPSTTAPRKLSVHSIMEYVEGTEGEGVEFGNEVHLFAELYAKDRTQEADNPHKKNIKAFIDSLEGELIPEEFCLFPIEIDIGAGKVQKVVLNGIIDLIHIDGDTIRVIDYKTDGNRKALNEYTKQLSVYYHVVESVYNDKTVEAFVFFTHEAHEKGLISITPLTIEELKEIVKKKAL